MSNNKKYDVFISYSRIDSSVAREICREFEKVNITFFIDYNGILSGQDFINVIIKAINESSVFLFLASTNSYASQITIDEVFEALEGVAKGSNHIVTYIIDGSELPKELKFRLRRYNWSNKDEHPIQPKLIDDILKLLGRERPDVSDSESIMEKAEELSALGRSQYEKQQYDDAINNFMNAIKTGAAYHDRAVDCNTVGHMYQYGIGIDKDEIEAVSWYRRAAELGSGEAQYNLGFMYYYGKGVKQDFGVAFQWLSLSAEQGNKNAMLDIAYMYRYGKGVSIDNIEAIKWYRRLAELKDPIAQYNLGDMYKKGLGVDRDLQKAAQWYKLASDQGNAEAQCALGYMYGRGEGVDKNVDEEIRLYKLSAEGGFYVAQCNLGYYYETGKNVEKDIDEAIKWYKMAASQGNARAKENLKRLQEEKSRN